MTCLIKFLLAVLLFGFVAQASVPQAVRWSDDQDVAKVNSFCQPSSPPRACQGGSQNSRDHGISTNSSLGLLQLRKLGVVRLLLENLSDNDTHHGASNDTVLPENIIDSWNSALHKMFNIDIAEVCETLSKRLREMKRIFLPGFHIDHQLMLFSLWCYFLAACWFFVYLNYLYIPDHVGLVRDRDQSHSTHANDMRTPELLLAFDYPEASPISSSNCVDMIRRLQNCSLRFTVSRSNADAADQTTYLVHRVATKDLEDRFPKLMKELSPTSAGEVRAERILTKEGKRVSLSRATEPRGSSHRAAGGSSWACLSLGRRVQICSARSVVSQSSTDAAHDQWKYLVNKAAQKDLEDRVVKLKNELNQTGGASVRVGNVLQKETKQALLRCALLQDLTQFLTSQGFDVANCWVDQDEQLYLTVAFRNTRIMKKYLVRDNVKVQMRHEVVTDLGIERPPEEPQWLWESSPPFLRFDTKYAQWLQDSGDVSDLYQLDCLFEGENGAEGVLMSSADRIRAIFGEISSYIDLDGARSEGLLRNWYPLHSPEVLEELRQIWTFTRFFDFTVVQPVHALKDYFGTRVAYILAWHGMYCKMLIALAPLALLCEVGMVMHSPHLLAFGLVLPLWSKIAANLWDRENELLSLQWGGLEREVAPQLRRSRFQGTMQRAPHDHAVFEPYYPPWKAALRRTFAYAITIFFCLLVAGVTETWILVFDKPSASASILLSIQIVTLKFIFDYVATILVEFENHEYHRDLYNSLLVKQFMFRTFNSYYPFYHLILFDRGCQTEHLITGETCSSLDKVQSQLLTTLGILFLLRILSFGGGFLYVKMQLWMSGKDVLFKEKQAGDRFKEAQAKYQHFGIREQVDKMLELVVSLGYLFLFGAAAPLIAVLCMFIFLLELRAAAFLLTTDRRRPFPYIGVSIGHWQGAIQVLMGIGVFTNAIIIVRYGSAFRNHNFVVKLSGGVIYIILTTYLMHGLADCLVPAHDEAVDLINKRRKWIWQVIQRKVTDEINNELIKEEKLSRTPTIKQSGPIVDRILKGKWRSIPHGSDEPDHG